LDKVNYGVSPGDDDIPEPYAYVGPWTPRTGDFWNATFGATRLTTELSETAALTSFFKTGRSVRRLARELIHTTRQHAWPRDQVVARRCTWRQPATHLARLMDREHCGLTRP
jgi:hypothetical protein